MKKARIMLLLLAVTLVVGTSLAFVSKRVFNQNFVYTGTIGSGRCTTLTFGTAIVNGAPNCAASPNSMTVNCPDVRTIAVDN